MNIALGYQVLLTFVVCYLTKKTDGCELGGLTGWRVNEVAQEWQQKILDKEYVDIYMQLILCPPAWSLPILTHSLKNVYANDHMDIHYLIYFVAYIPNNDCKVQGFETLAAELSSSGRSHSHEMMVLIYEIKIRHNALKGAKGYIYLKSKLPTNIRAIVFGECTYIKFTNVGELMYESNYWWDGEYRVQTWVAGANDDRDSEWYFEPHEENGSLFFYIKNNYRGKGRVLALSDWYNDDFGKYVAVHTNNNGGTYTRWRVQPVTDGNFIIQHWNGDFLYASKKWCRKSAWECFWTFGRKPFVHVDDVSKYKWTRIYPNGKSCGF